MALSIPDFARIVSFVGAIFSFLMSGVFPPLFYMRLAGRPLSIYERILHWSIIVLCTCLAALGTYGAIFTGS